MIARAAGLWGRLFWFQNVRWRHVGRFELKYTERGKLTIRDKPNHFAALRQAIMNKGSFQSKVSSSRTVTFSALLSTFSMNLFSVPYWELLRDPFERRFTLMRLFVSLLLGRFTKRPQAVPSHAVR